jgi:hypothetical protein
VAAWLAVALACLPWHARASADAPAGAPVEAPAHCDGEVMPTLEAPYELRCAHDFNIRSFERTNDDADLGPAIRLALEQLSSSDASGRRHVSLFLPAGTYRCGGSLEIPAGTGLVGSPAGITRLQPLRAGPGVITTGPSRAGARVLIEGLHLPNARIELGAAPSIVRFNALTGLRSRTKSQIEVKAGRHRLEGNVLWRSARWPGVGISIGAVPAAGASDGLMTVVGNLIGAVSAGESSTEPASRAHAVARRLIAERRQSRDADTSLLDTGHYRNALMSLLSAAPLEVRNNEVMLNAAPPSDIEARHVAFFSAPSGLTLQGNRFGRDGDWGQDTPSVKLLAPSGTSVTRNEFTQVSLVIDGPRVKNTNVDGNRFGDTRIEIQAQVDGTAATATTPSDLQVDNNRFNPSIGCDIMRRPSTIGTPNFDPTGNLKGPDNLRQPADVCAH